MRGDVGGRVIGKCGRACERRCGRACDREMWEGV